MSDLVAAAIKIVFLALLWLFIGILADVIRKDMFGRKVSASDLPANEQGPARRGKASFQPTRFAITQGAQQGLSIPLELAPRDLRGCVWHGCQHDGGCHHQRQFGTRDPRVLHRGQIRHRPALRLQLQVL